MGTANTLALANGLVTLLQGLQLNGQPLFLASSVQIGEIQDPTDIVPCCSVTWKQRQSERFNSGWQIHSKPTFQIETLCDLKNATAAETFIMQAGDLITGLFISRASVPGAPQVYMVQGGLGQNVPAPDTTSYKLYPGGKVFRVHQCLVQAVDQYQVVIQ